MDKTASVKERIIRNAYYDINSVAAFAGVDKVYREAKRHDASITREDVLKYLQSEPTYTLHRPSRKRYKRLKTMPTGLNSDWQCDLAIFDKIRKYNNNFPYCLVCIDVLSRKIYVTPAKSKSSGDMIVAFNKIWKKSKGIKPNKLYSDQGWEFQARQMKEYFSSLNIQKFVTYSQDVHAALAERANRTIKDRLYRYFTQYKTWRWIDVIDRLVENINNSVNRTTGVAPNSVTYKNSQDIFTKLYKRNPDQEFHEGTRYKVGDIVRIDREKGKFGKGYLPSYTEELFRITKAKPGDSIGNPSYYRIEALNGEQILGIFYNENLSKTTIDPNSRISEIIKERINQRGHKEYLVRWIGEEIEPKWVKDSKNYQVI